MFQKLNFPARIYDWFFAVLVIFPFYSRHTEPRHLSFSRHTSNATAFSIPNSICLLNFTLQFRVFFGVMEHQENQNQQQQQQPDSNQQILLALTAVLSKLTQQPSPPSASPNLPSFLKLPTFSGSEQENAEQFIRTISDIFNINEISFPKRLSYLFTSFTKTAASWFAMNVNNFLENGSWDTFVEQFKTRFVRLDVMRNLRGQLFLIQQGSMNISEYISHFVKRLVPFPDLSEETKTVLFINSLRDDLRKAVSSENPVNLEIAMTRAYAFGTTYMHPSTIFRTPSVPLDHGPSPMEVNATWVSSAKNRNHQIKSDQNKPSRPKFNHDKPDQIANRVLSKEQCLEKGACFFCKHDGHTIDACRKLKKKNAEKSQSRC